MKICQTFISDTKDLFVLIYMDQKYHLYELNLDKMNIKNFQGTDQELNDLYKINDPILCFDAK